MFADISFEEGEMMKLLHLFITSSKPVVEILLITTVGFYMALDGVNLLGQDARKFLNNVRLLLYPLHSCI